MAAIAQDWELDVARGPDWLLVKVGTTSDKMWDLPPLADRLRWLLRQHFTYRLVLELDQVRLLSSDLITQLLLLRKWIHAHQGVIRLCGLSPHNAEVLHRCRLNGLLPAYRDRLEAVLGCYHPSQPR